jgi:hypothetical protein
MLAKDIEFYKIYTQVILKSVGMQHNSIAI